MRYALGIVLLAVVGLMVYIRLAPHDVSRWHAAIETEADADFPQGAIRVIEVTPAALQKADHYMRDLPRTFVLAGSVEEGRITYVTRSKIFGFPDYTTLQMQDDGSLRAHARSRFGQSDLGVNRKRLDGLIASLQ